MFAYFLLRINFLFSLALIDFWLRLYHIFWIVILFWIYVLLLFYNPWLLWLLIVCLWKFCWIVFLVHQLVCIYVFYGLQDILWWWLANFYDLILFLHACHSPKIFHHIVFKPFVIRFSTYISSIVNEVNRTLSSLFIFFTKRFRAHKNTHKQTLTNKTKLFVHYK